MLSLGAHIPMLASFAPHAPRPHSRHIAPSSSAPLSQCFRHRLAAERSRRPSMAAAVSLEGSDGLVHDLGSAAVTAGVALALLRFFEELARRGVCEQKLNRKLVHISVGMVFLLFWPLFSSGRYAPLLAAVAPGVNVIRMLLLGLGIMKNDAMVKSMSRSGDCRYSRCSGKTSR